MVESLRLPTTTRTEASSVLRRTRPPLLLLLLLWQCRSTRCFSAPSRTRVAFASSSSSASSSWSARCSVPDGAGDSWDLRYEELLEYRSVHGDTLVPARSALGYWVTRQRSARDKLSPERLKALESIDFVWNPAQHRWDQTYECLKLELSRERENRENDDVDVDDDDGGGGLWSRLPARLGNWVSRQRRAHREGSLDAHRVARLEELPGFEWNPSKAVHDERLWNERYEELREFARRHNGRTDVPRRWPSNPRLGYWVKHQRHRFKDGVSEEDDPVVRSRYEKLRALDFRWTTDVDDSASSSSLGWIGHESRWNERYAELVEYAAAHGGDTNVPSNWAPNPALGLWVRTQRTKYRSYDENEQDSASRRRYEKLAALNFNFGGKDESTWQSRYEELLEYKEKHGHCRVSTTEKPLGPWAYHQRRKWRRKELDEESVRLLEEAGFDWEVNSWETKFDALKEELERGDGGWDDLSTSLRTWVRAQRRNRREGLLRDDRAKSLEALPGFEWYPTNARWNARYEELKAYAAEHDGDADVPTVFGPNPRLGRWVRNQRYRFRGRDEDDPVAAAYVRKLNAVDFRWTSGRRGGSVDGTRRREDGATATTTTRAARRVRKTVWDQRYDELKEYAATHGGSTDVPAEFPDNPKLGRWVQKQRSKLLSDKSDPVTLSRIQKLNDLKFNWIFRVRPARKMKKTQP